MANTMTLISSVTAASGGSASLGFTSIPQTYTDLLIKITGRGLAAGVARNIAVSFNGSSSNYTMINLVNEGGSALSYTQAAYGGQNAVAYAAGGSATASTFSNGDLYFSNYTGSGNKSVSVNSISENNVTAGWGLLGGSLWQQTAAITSLAFTLDSGNWAQYSTAYLYGISKTP